MKILLSKDLFSLKAEVIDEFFKIKNLPYIPYECGDTTIKPVITKFRRCIKNEFLKGNTLHYIYLDKDYGKLIRNVSEIFDQIDPTYLAASDIFNPNSPIRIDKDFIKIVEKRGLDNISDTTRLVIYDLKPELGFYRIERYDSPLEVIEISKTPKKGYRQII